MVKHTDLTIGLIHASQDLIKETLRIAKEKNYHLIAEPFCIDTAIPVGKRMESEGVDVIVSRRYTASVLRNHLNIPVLAVPITFFDIYQNMWRAAKKWKTILFPVYRGSMDRKHQLNEMIDADIFYYEYSTTDQVEAAVLWGKQQGCQGIVAGPVTKGFALKHGMECEEITLSRESIEFTLEEAYWVAVNRRKEKEQNQLYKAIVNMGSKCVIAVDQAGSIKIFNGLAGDLLKIEENREKPQNIKEILDVEEVLESIQTGRFLNYHIGKIGNRTYLFEYLPTELENKIIGGILTLQDTQSVLKAEGEIRKNMARGLVAKYSIEEFIYEDPETEKLIKRAKNFAACDSTILITGPTGTGKEILAHGIHRLSKRNAGPFVSINCASIPEQLLENELFGHEEGSFTGARRGGKPGLFELAHKGTIFLDEIGSMPPSLQARLLRVLQEREVMRVGGDKLLPINVRVLAATNEDLRQGVLDGRFRQDLFFRINVLSLQIPALRERVRDIPILVKKLIDQTSRRLGIPSIKMPDSCIEKLSSLMWPGNVRELLNFIEKLLILCTGSFSHEIFGNLFIELLSYSQATCPGKMESDVINGKTIKQNTVSTESDYILNILQQSKYNKTIAAQKLGISKTTLWRKMKKIKQA